MLAVLIAFFWLRPRIHLQQPTVVPSLDESSRTTVAQPSDLKRSSPQPAKPHELSILDVATYTWFDPGTRQALVWYSPSTDGSFRYFDGPGVDPQSGQSLNPVTPEFVENLKPRLAPQPIAHKEKTQITVSSKAKETPVSNSSADSLPENAQWEDKIQQAQLAVNAKDYRTAVDLCTKVLMVKAGSQPCMAIHQHASVKLAEQLVNEGTADWEKGEFDKALRSAEQALDLDPANQDATRLKNLALKMKPRASK
jgi:tetratricopeptide (TPR) repeat protein